MISHEIFTECSWDDDDDDDDDDDEQEKTNNLEAEKMPLSHSHPLPSMIMHSHPLFTAISSIFHHISEAISPSQITQRPFGTHRHRPRRSGSISI